MWIDCPLFYLLFLSFEKEWGSPPQHILRAEHAGCTFSSQHSYRYVLLKLHLSQQCKKGRYLRMLTTTLILLITRINSRDKKWSQMLNVKWPTSFFRPTNSLPVSLTNSHSHSNSHVKCPLGTHLITFAYSTLVTTWSSAPCPRALWHEEYSNRGSNCQSTD